MTSFCPIIKEDCKGSKCISWKDDNCLIFFWLELSTQSSKKSMEEDDDFEFEFEEKSHKKVPAKIESSTVEQLANDLLEFTKKEFEGEEGYQRRIRVSSNSYWEKIGLDRFYFDLPVDIRLKLEKAERLAQKQVDIELEAKTKKRLDAEKAKLPELIDKCKHWAINRGVKKIILADLDVFLLEEDIKLLPQTKRAILATTNLDLKSSKR